MNLKTLIGKQIDRLELNKDRDEFSIYFADNMYIQFGVEGDCCSHSWIEHLEAPNNIHNAVILDIRNGGEIPWDNHQCTPNTVEDGKYAYGNKCGHDHLQVYNTIFDTDKGTVILEYRNDSNGYYGGDLVIRNTNIIDGYGYVYY